jgi:predicted phage tail protein
MIYLSMEFHQKGGSYMKGILRFVALPLILIAFGISLNGCGGGSDSTAIPIAPSAPSNVSATPGDSLVAVSWKSVFGATSYNIYYATTPGVTKSTGAKIENAKSPYEITGLTNGTTYYFVVTAVNAFGESSESSEQAATPIPLPAPPTGASATPGDGQVTYTWNPVATATSYNIYYSTASPVTKTSGIKIANVTSPKVITGLTNGTTYYFVVTAVNAAGESVESPEDSATPSAELQPPASPNGVSATAGTGKVTVQWNTKLTATSYNIYYIASSPITSADLMATGTKVNVLALSADPQPATQSHDITGLTPGTTYSFVVTSVNAAGESGTQNNPKTATPL